MAQEPYNLKLDTYTFNKVAQHYPLEAFQPCKTLQMINKYFYWQQEM